ncbi:hypothetical protein C900_04146 [Fulvivirga imtechensis AK7]|uniref:Uncharacterized protein n=1 Tax=Fulvivirga imtechensis AK7 TaxID=1237149 RepID=L8K035_9BACT|nr:hypothetical protein C900_04146 [Fulvivirga imtechensis AK7]
MGFSGFCAKEKIAQDHVKSNNKYIFLITTGLQILTLTIAKIKGLINNSRKRLKITGMAEGGGRGAERPLNGLNCKL